MSDFGGINVTNEICEITCIHEEQVTNSKERLKNTNSKDLSSLFKILSDENRFKILHALAYEDQLCVCDVANIIGATMANTSHHLQALKKLGVVDSKKIGKLVYYFSSDDRIVELINLGKQLEQGDGCE